jgi:hypothetical protein
VMKIRKCKPVFPRKSSSMTEKRARKWNSQINCK